MLSLEKLKKIPARSAYLRSLLAICFIGAVDYFLPPDIFTSIFYVLPIMLAGWTGIRWMGVSMALLSGLFWMLTDIASGHLYPHPAILPWNTLVRTATFLVVALLTLAFRKALNVQEQIAQTDGLTGAANLRSFRERLDREYQRCARYGRVFTVAGLDVDNFKYVNDTMGHQVGDYLLIMVVETLRNSLRKLDLVARLGGDEFAVLLPETASAEAREALAHAVAALRNGMAQQGWPVSFSVGVVTFVDLPGNSDGVMKIVDDLMYGVKNSGKDNVAYLVWGA